MKIYVASSWTNKVQPEVIRFLRDNWFEPYDFRNPIDDNSGFVWSDISTRWKQWTTAEYIRGLEHPLARDAFAMDSEAMAEADALVLVLPCGASAHVEAGWFSGSGKPVIVYITSLIEPELMYSMFHRICDNLEELRRTLAELDGSTEERKQA